MIKRIISEKTIAKKTLHVIFFIRNHFIRNQNWAEKKLRNSSTEITEVKKLQKIVKMMTKDKLHI